MLASPSRVFLLPSRSLRAPWPWRSRDATLRSEFRGFVDSCSVSRLWPPSAGPPCRACFCARVPWGPLRDGDQQQHLIGALPLRAVATASAPTCPSVGRPTACMACSLDSSAAAGAQICRDEIFDKLPSGSGSRCVTVCLVPPSGRVESGGWKHDIQCSRHFTSVLAMLRHI